MSGKQQKKTDENDLTRDALVPLFIYFFVDESTSKQDNWAGQGSPSSTA